MDIIQNSEVIVINFKDSSTYYYLQTVIERSLPSKIGRKKKMIIFPKEDELTQRRYFMKLICKIYKRMNPKIQKRELEQIQTSYKKTIKLSLIQENQVLPSLSIPVDFNDEGAILFHLQSHNRLFVSYMKNYFKDHLIQYRLKTKILTVYPNSHETIGRLNRLFEEREHMAWYIAFDYNQDAFSHFADYWFKKAERKQRFKALSGVLEEYFATLGCKDTDSFSTIRGKYLKLVKLYHPDHNTQNNSLTISHYRKKFEKIQIAYELVKAYYTQEKIGVSA